MRPGAMPFSSSPRRAAARAIGSFSVPQTRPAPSFTARKAMTPLPVPTSSTSAPGSRARSSSSPSRHSAVVGWLPVPKAMPGSITTRASPGEAGASSHGGCTQDLFPTRSGRWCLRQATLQSRSATSTGDSVRPRSRAESSAASRSAKWAMHRPAPGGSGGVPGMSCCSGSCSSTPWAPRSKSCAARTSRSPAGAVSTKAQLTTAPAESPPRAPPAPALRLADPGPAARRRGRPRR